MSCLFLFRRTIGRKYLYFCGNVQFQALQSVTLFYLPALWLSRCCWYRCFSRCQYLHCRVQKESFRPSLSFGFHLAARHISNFSFHLASEFMKKWRAKATAELRSLSSVWIKSGGKKCHWVILRILVEGWLCSPLGLGGAGEWCQRCSGV